MSSKFMNPAFIGAKSPLLMNGLDSIVINFPQVQPRQSVTSIKARQLCHFRARVAQLSGARAWPALPPLACGWCF